MLYRIFKKHKKKNIFTSEISELAKSGYTTICDDSGIEIFGNGIFVRGDAPDVICAARDVFATEEYKFNPSGHEYIIFDIGLNVGIASLYFAQQDFIKKVYGFEPFKPTYAQAERNMLLNPELSQKIKIFNFGLSDKNTELELPYDLNRTGSMSSMPVSGRRLFSNMEKINLCRASDILSPIIEKHDLYKIGLKIDCEGAEIEIIPDLEKSGLLRKIDLIILEYHSDNYNTLINILKDKGFNVTRNHHTGAQTGIITAAKSIMSIIPKKEKEKFYCFGKF